MDTPGARLRAGRERLGMSQAEFAAACKVHRRTQVNYELDRRRPNAAYLDAIDELGLDSVYVVSGNPVNSGTSLLEQGTFVARQLLLALGLSASDQSVFDLARLLSDAAANEESDGEGYGRTIGKASARTVVIARSPTVSRWLIKPSSDEAELLRTLLIVGASKEAAPGTWDWFSGGLLELEEVRAALDYPRSRALIELLPWLDDDTIDALIGIGFQRRMKQLVPIQSRLKPMGSRGRPRG